MVNYGAFLLCGQSKWDEIFYDDRRAAKRETKALAEEFKNRLVVASSKNAWVGEGLTLL